MNKLAVLDIVHREHFSVPEWLEREKCIATVRQYDKARLLAEQALTQIRDKKLYRPYKTLKEFCLSMFGWSDRRTQQVLAYEKVVTALPKGKRTMVRTERVARELLNFSKDQRVEVLNEAGKDGKITAKSVKEAAAELKKTQGADGTSEIPVTDVEGRVVPEIALKYWNRRDQAKEVIGALRAAKRAVNALDNNDVMWVEVNLNGVLGDISAAINRFGSALPEYVCPYCGGNGVIRTLNLPESTDTGQILHLPPDGHSGAKGEINKGKCDCCKGRGVISKFMWVHAIPEEMKK